MLDEVPVITPHMLHMFVCSRTRANFETPTERELILVLRITVLRLEQHFLILGEVFKEAGHEFANGHSEKKVKKSMTRFFVCFFFA